MPRAGTARPSTAEKGSAGGCAASAPVPLGSARARRSPGGRRRPGPGGAGCLQVAVAVPGWMRSKIACRGTVSGPSPSSSRRASSARDVVEVGAVVDLGHHQARGLHAISSFRRSASLCARPSCGRDVARDAQQADDPAALVAQRQLAGLTGSASEPSGSAQGKLELNCFARMVAVDASRSFSRSRRAGAGVRKDLASVRPSTCSACQAEPGQRGRVGKR